MKLLPFFVSGNGIEYYRTNRKGRSLVTVNKVYAGLGTDFSSEIKQEIKNYCSVEMRQYGQGEPFECWNVDSIATTVTAGLLLGYPIESTWSFMFES